MRINKSGFTLIELIIVIVIIGILASIAAPMMGGVKARAICAEAVTTLGTLRTSLRQYYVEYNAYPEELGPVYIVPSDFPGIDVYKIGGVYFGYSCYFLRGDDISNPRIYCMPTPNVGSANNAPKAIDAQKAADNTDAKIYMYIISGKITQSGFSRSGYEGDPNPLP